MKKKSDKCNNMSDFQKYIKLKKKEEYILYSTYIMLKKSKGSVMMEIRTVVAKGNPD